MINVTQGRCGNSLPFQKEEQQDHSYLPGRTVLLQMTRCFRHVLYKSLTATRHQGLRSHNSLLLGSDRNRLRGRCGRLAGSKRYTGHKSHHFDKFDISRRYHFVEIDVDKFCEGRSPSALPRSLWSVEVRRHSYQYQLRSFHGACSKLAVRTRYH